MLLRRPTRVAGFPYVGFYRYSLRFATHQRAHVFVTAARVDPLQDGYYERVLRSDEATDVVVRYVLNNPVRAGLVERAEDYSFSGAKYWPEA